MSKAEWERAYRQAWETYYTDEHIGTVLRRAIATGTSPGKTMFFITWFKGCIGIEKIHPLEGGFLRLKHRRSRRSELPLESPLSFYPRYFANLLMKQWKWIALYLRLRLIYLKIKRDPNRLAYMDLALEPLRADETETRQMFQSETAQKYVNQVKRMQKIRQGQAV